MSDDARPAGGSTAPAEHELLTRLGKYVIERKLGSGGMGTVFLAKDSDLKRTVALKVLAKDRAENPVLVRRFKAEGQAAAYLQHKNIVGVYDSGQIDGFLYIALEFVEGQDVLDIIRKRGVIPVKRSIEIIRQVADALQHAYEKQIVHRDIKPSNLLIKTDGTVKLADLGLARSIDETLDTSITRVGTTVGTVDYMSPEQARNSKATDIRSDIYSLGCTWYHMLTGVPPYGEGSVTNKLQAHATAPLPDPRSRNERIPEGVVAVLHRMMAKQAKDRYQTPAELLEDLNNPGIARSGLNADVLAALAQPAAHPDQESSSGDLFESRVPFDSVELDAAVQTLRQDALPTGVVFDDPDNEPDEQPLDGGQSTPTRRRPRPAPEKDAPARKAPAREERVEEPDRPIPPRRPAKTRPSADDPGRSGPVPRRQSKAERQEPGPADSAKHRFKQRKLPPRDSDTSLEAEPVRMSLDPDRIRAIILGGVVLAILAGIGFALSRMTGSSGAATSESGPSAVVNSPQELQQPVPEAVPPTAPDDSQASGKPSAPAERNDATTPLRKAARPIAGAEDLADLNSALARQFIPDWLFKVRQPPADNAKTIVVRRPGTPGDGVPTFAEALDKLPPGPAVVEFRGDGPFLIPSSLLPARPQIVLQAQPGSRPLLVFRTADLKAGDACLRAEGPIAFRGVHLVLATEAGSAAGLAMIEATSLQMRDCTLQSVGPGTRGTTLVRLKAGPQDATGGIFENCSLRSMEGHGLQLAGANSRIVAGNSLFCFDSGSVISLSPAPARASEGREITLLRSTVIAGRTAITTMHEGPDRPAPVAFTLRKSTCSAATPSATLLSFQGWTASEDPLAEKPVPLAATWKSDQSSLQGWDALAHLVEPSGKATIYEGESGWQKFWRQSHAGTQLVEQPPEVPADFTDREVTDLVSLGSTRETGPGCRIVELASPPAELVHRVRVLASARRLPEDFIAFRKPSSVVQFDFAPGTLGALLNDSSKCPEGALVQLRGAGIKALPAIEIQNRTLQIEFIQSEGAPLTIRPQPGLDAAALITINGGQIAITNGRFLLPESDRQAYPRSLFEIAGGSFALTNCILNGPVQESTRLGPLIHWKAGPENHALLIRDSFLTGGRSALDADLAGRLLDIDNSILAATADAVSLSLSDAARPGNLAMTSSTLGGGRSILNLESMPSGDGQPLTVIVKDSIVLATPAAAGPTPMLAASSPDDLLQVTWWEDGVGYAPRTSPSVQVASESEKPADWTARWGPGHVLRVCSSELAVLFEKPLESLAKADLEMFRLNSGCLAATWSSTGGPLGASGPNIGVTAEAKAPPPTEKETRRPPVTPPSRPRTVF